MAETRESKVASVVAEAVRTHHAKLGKVQAVVAKKVRVANAVTAAAAHASQAAELAARVAHQVKAAQRSHATCVGECQHGE